MTEKRKPSPSTAFHAYVQLGRNRSIKWLTESLTDQGYAISRNTLTKWAKEGNWEEKARSEGGGDILPAHVIAASVERRREAVDAMLDGKLPDLDKVREAQDNLALFATSLIQHVADAVPGLHIRDIDDALVMARAAAHIAEAAAKIRTSLAGIADLDAKILEMPKAPGTTPGLSDALATFR